MKNYYSILGVEPGVSKKELKEAYLKRVRVVHPDRFDQKTQAVEWRQANDMLSEINEAYSKLKGKDTAEPDVPERGDEREPFNYACLAAGETTLHVLPEEVQDRLINEIKGDGGAWLSVKTGTILWNYIFLGASICWFVLLFAYPKGRSGADPAFITITLVASVIAGLNLEKVYRWHASQLCSYLVLTPLYFINIDFDIIKFKPLWFLRDVRAEYRQKNGSDAGATLKLIFEGRDEKLHFHCMEELKDFCGRYDKYVEAIRYESRAGNTDYFLKEDVFADCRGSLGVVKRSHAGKAIFCAMSVFLGMNAFFLTAPLQSQKRLWNPADVSVRSFKYLPPEKPVPPTGWSRDFSTDAAAIAPLTLAAPSGEMNYFIKICDWKTDREIKAVFVRAGETAEAKLPLGSYRLKFAMGARWYGEDRAFGDMDFKYLEKELECTRNGNVITGYTVRLDEAPPYGTLDTKEVGREE